MKYHYQKQMRRHDGAMESAWSILAVVCWIVISALLFDMLVFNGILTTEMLVRR